MSIEWIQFWFGQKLRLFPSILEQSIMAKHIKSKNIHLHLSHSIFFHSLSQLPLGEWQGTPCTGSQLIAEPHRAKQDKQPYTLTLTPSVNLESPINLICMFLYCWRK